MPEVMLARAPVDPAREQRVRDWFAELTERESEVAETLEHEGVYTETAFLLDTEDDLYLYIFMEAEDLEKADEAGNEEEYDIDEEHHEFLRDVRCGEWEPLETLAHFPNPGLR